MGIESAILDRIVDAAFQRLDTNQDGKLELSEIIPFIRSNFGGDQNSHISTMVSYLDQYGSRALSREDLKALLIRHST